MKRIGMLTSGGDCQALNAAMRGVVKTLANGKEEVEIYGFLDGYRGLIYGNFRMLTDKDFSGILTKGGTILGTSRTPFKTIQDPDPNGLNKVEAMKQNYYKLQLDCLVILGGNGTHKTANLLRKEGLNIVTLPKTIDNDLIETDHTPGFGSAAKYVAATVREIVLDASVYEQKAVTIIELMGRHAGWLTAASVLARKKKDDNPVLIYLPESNFDLENFARDLKQALEKRNCVIVCVSEGISDASGKFICEYGSEASVDNFGHKMLTGCGKVLENFVRNRFGVKVRSVELNVSQRCSGMVVSRTDVEEAALAGMEGVKVAFARLSNPGEEYRMECRFVDVNQVCNQEKAVPAEWITGDGNDIGEKFIQYALPLIQGEPERIMENGIPKYLYR